MTYFSGLAAVTALFTIGTTVYAPKHGESVRKGAQAATLVFFLFQPALIVTGCWHSEPALTRVHQWLGHFVIEVGCCALAPSLGYLFLHGFGNRRIRTFLRICVPLFAVGIAVLASFTGYLMPPPNADIPEFAREETQNRFFVLHQVFLPTVITVLAALWLWTLRPKVEANQRTETVQ